MSFAAPLVLLGLLAIPVLVVWYVLAGRARERSSEAFASPLMRDSVAPHRPGRRRHAPMLAFLLAIVALVLAAARPAITVTTSRQRLNTMLAIDVSGSMAATDVKPNRVTAAQHAADTFVTEAPPQVKIGVMEFNQAPEVLALPTRDRVTAYEALGRLRVSGGTAIGTALQTALGILSPSAGTDPSTGVATGAASSTTAKAARGVIVLVSDGKSVIGPNPVTVARRAARLHIPIFTVSLGTEGGTISVPGAKGTGTVTVAVPPDHAALAQIARASGGRAYTAADAGRLSAIYRQIGLQITSRTQRRDITPYLIGAGLLLALLGVSMSLGWFGRPI